MTTFAALGDSITLGVGDPIRISPAGAPSGKRRAAGAGCPAGNGSPAGNGQPGRAGNRRRAVRAWRGWAALLAESLPDTVLYVLAGNGACVADVERDQLRTALQLRPDLASVIMGVNDTLRPEFDPVRIGVSAAHVVGSLRAAGAEVLTMRVPDPGRMLGVPGPLARPLARRAQQLNEVLDEVAKRFGTLHFDAASEAHVYDLRMWAVDRLHPSERGHRLIARRFHALLAESGHPVGPPPGAEPLNPPPNRTEQLAWMATKGTVWVLRRSTDLVPGLLAMAFAEWRGGPERASGAGLAGSRSRTVQHCLGWPAAGQGRSSDL